MKTELINQLSGSDAHFPACTAWVEIVRAGHGDGSSLPFNWDDHVTVIRKGRKIVALIVWRELKWLQEAAICVGWVSPTMRRQGLYRALYIAVKEEAKKRGALRIVGGVSPRNNVIRSVARSQGRKLYSENWQETL